GSTPPTIAPPRDRDASGVPGPAGRSAPPSRPGAGTPIPVGATPPRVVARPEAPGRPSAKTLAFWDQYYKANDLPALELFETVTRLRKDGKFQEIEAAIRGYLVYHGKRAQPWMYEMLAVAMEVNKAGTDRV